MEELLKNEFEQLAADDNGKVISCRVNQYGEEIYGSGIIAYKGFKVALNTYRINASNQWEWNCCLELSNEQYQAIVAFVGA